MKKSVLIFIALVLLQGCNSNTRYKNTESVPADCLNIIVMDYIDSDVERIVKYGIEEWIDSVRIYSPTGHFQTAQYGFDIDKPFNFVLKKRYYNNGSLDIITMGINSSVKIRINGVEKPADMTNAKGGGYEKLKQKLQ